MKKAKLASLETVYTYVINKKMEYIDKKDSNET